ncbi:MAG: hypothetical protein JK586_13310 [Nocardiopsis sp. BM-2018]|nr:MAG: hypothetical protein JK586_13310 [Nocardiopsis sp. BM-2018]
MEQVRINADLFEAMGADGAKQVAEIMRESGLVKGEVEIVGDKNVAAPELSDTVYSFDMAEAMMHAMDSGDMGPEFRIRLPRIRIPPVVCRTACDAAAAAATAKAAALSGPLLVAALAAIKLARDECRRRC